MGAQNNRQASDPMEQGIKRWQYGLAGLGVVLVAAYLVYFGVWLGQMPSDDSEKWGQFGDFVGGLLNPVVAFAAFYWLTQSVKLQKTELAEARTVAQASLLALKQQALSSDEQTGIAARTALASAMQPQIDSLTRAIVGTDEELQATVLEILRLEDQISKSHANGFDYMEDATSRYTLLKKQADCANQKILGMTEARTGLLIERDECLNELRKCVAEVRAKESLPR